MIGRSGRRQLRRRSFFVSALLLLAGVTRTMPATADTPAAGDTVALTTYAVAPTLCSSAGAFAIADSLSGTMSPCALRPLSIVLETVYLQNASAVGGTALAAYPLVRVRAGLLPRLQFTFDGPSAIAQSRPGGGGAFPVTHLGYGLTYTVSESLQSATALITEVLPPDSRFAPAHVQARYLVGLTTSVAVTRKWTLGGQATGISSAQAGFGRVLPTLNLSAAYAPNPRTQIATGLGTRIVTRYAVAQSFGDIAVNEVLNKKLLFTVGVGTTFNPVNDAKPHYLATGFTYRP